ncbi:MAG TPA: response regulator [Thermoanaerobaculia bacterium]|nr:response regulator [Thermoanaerobaculia bacterium]
MNRILLVEDNEDDIDLTLLAFQRSRLANEVIVARDGVEALTLLHGDAETPPLPPPTVVLLDLKLPRIDGFEVLRQIRANPATRLLPVVVLTSSAQERDLVQTYASGANSYIVKPVDFEQFLESAQQIGMYWLMLNSTPPAEGS